MTDTGQVPGEGLPESAGTVEQPGVPPHGAYTYLSETTAEDDDLLLLPGAQSPWGNEVAPPAPEPVVETVHEPGAHEAGGRDSGSVDLNGVRLPNPAAPTSRRPLHLGPPIPDASASPVRSLADRGPAGVPARRPGPPTTGPEYFDAPQLRETAPQGGAPWGAQAQAAVQVPVGTEAPAAETVVPAAQTPEPQLAHGVQAAPGHEIPYEPQPTPAAGVAHTPEAAQAVAAAYDPESGQIPVDVSAVDGGNAGGFPVGDSPVDGGLVAAGGLPVDGGPVGAGGPVAEDGQVAPGGSPVENGHVALGVIPAENAHVASGEFPEPAGFPGYPEFPADGGQTASAEAGEQVPPGAPAAEGEPAAPAEAAADAEQGAAHVPAQDAGQETAGTVPESGPNPDAVLAAESAPAHGAAPLPEATPAHGVIPMLEPVQSPEAVHAEEGVAPAEAGPSLAEPHAAETAAAPEGAQFAQPLMPENEYLLGTLAPGGAQLPHAVAPEAAPLPHAVAAADAAQAPEAAAPDAGQPAEGVALGTAAPSAIAEPAQPQPAQPEPAQPEPAQAEVVQPAEAGPAAPAQPADASADRSAAPAVDAIAAPGPALSEQAPAVPDTDVPPPADAPAAPAADQALPAVLPVPPAPEATAPAGTGVPAEQPHLAEAPAPAPGTEAADAGTDALRPPPVDEPTGQFVPVDGSVPTTPHLAPTPPHALVLPVEEEQAPEPVAMVPAPREADSGLVQNAEDLDTRAADQEEEGTAAVEEAPQSTGPAAPAYDDAEREAVLKVMRERRDIRNGFRSDPIPHEVLLRVLEAAHTAPSVGHSQPWDFVVIRSADTRRSMHELAMRQRDAYAKSLPKGRAKQFKELKIEAILDTPVNIVVTADPTRGGRHTLGRHTQPQMAPYSAALAVENLWLAARAEGLGVGWVSFFDEREMVRALGLPDHLEVIAYLCVGYVDEFPDEPELMQAGWSKRRPLSWVVHEETYGRRALPGEEPHDLLAETVAQIRPLDAKALGEAWERQKRMTKPAGALGMLEIISAQLSGLSRQCPPPIPEPAAVAIFAGDHGVHAQGVTPWPQEVTAQMVANFLGGGAVCNAFAGQVGAEVCVVDVGVATDLPATPGLLPRKVRAGTSDMTTGPAMSREEAKQAIEVGIETARDLVAAGNKALLTGEMGIANTTASAALISVFTDTDPADVTGRGTGINDETLARKTEVVRRAIEVHQPDPADPIGVLAAIGGFEHAAMVGLLLGGASLRTPVILDGVSAGAAALVARAIAPEVLAACIAGHRSAEPGHVAALNKLGLRPLVDLDLRLGEGTGALLALPLVQSTARAMHEVATFDSAGVTEK
ncbi:nicotinate-nucleotide--dimethylbenzimidazole phosphoribosyltransferase [Streptomyces sp. NPDC050523]|uniref:nicotinate-nucleotide--dimethylbenzimidazole phosphoribosyltransferase n=1 Tax=Streptomyces sp. NPDC050523 TaxID=3365622 RepID=UPI0037B095BC